MTVRRVFRLRARTRHDYAMRDRVMALYAPVALLILLAWSGSRRRAGRLLGDVLRARRAEPVRGVHAGGVVDADPGLRDASPDDAGVVLSFTAAGLGLVLLALFITYLPSLYGAFQRHARRGVAKLEVRAGQAAERRLPDRAGLDGGGGLRTSARSGPSGRTGSPTWTSPTARSRRSCSSAPPAPRSVVDHGRRCDPDGAALFASTVDTPRQPEPEFMIRSGTVSPTPGRVLPTSRSTTIPGRTIRSRSRGRSSRPWPSAYGPPACRCEQIDRSWLDFRRLASELRRGADRARRSSSTALRAPWSSDRYEDVHFVPPALPGSDGPGRDARVECPAPCKEGSAEMTEATFVTSHGFVSPLG